MFNISEADDFEIVTNKAAKAAVWKQHQEDADKKAAVWKKIKRILTRRQLCGTKSRG